MRTSDCTVINNHSGRNTCTVKPAHHRKYCSVQKTALLDYDIQTRSTKTLTRINSRRAICGIIHGNCGHCALLSTSSAGGNGTRIISSSQNRFLVRIPSRFSANDATHASVIVYLHRLQHKFQIATREVVNRKSGFAIFKNKTSREVLSISARFRHSSISIIQHLNLALCVFFRVNLLISRICDFISRYQITIV